eukprot:s23_g71.t1
MVTLAAELACGLRQFDIDLQQGDHVRSAANYLADALSRLVKGRQCLLNWRQCRALIPGQETPVTLSKQRCYASALLLPHLYVGGALAQRMLGDKGRHLEMAWWAEIKRKDWGFHDNGPVMD